MISVSYLVLAFLTCHRGFTSASNVTDEFPTSYLKYVQGNTLWTGIVKNCKHPTMICIQNQVFKYLKTTLDYPEDVEVASFLKFSKNKVDYGQIKRSITTDNATADGYVDDLSPLEEMSRSLQDNTLKFLMTHNLELQLPETVFQGAVLKLSPRSVEGNGALVKMEFLPPPDYEENVEQGRTIKKIKKFLGERLMYALMAILMVIKLLAVKFMFILPAVMGVAAAKKLIFKLLLFVFPALHHLFKWCAYVPHTTKFHHHKHHIQHYHHVGPHDHGHVEVIAPHSDGPPALHHSFDTHDPPGPYKHYYNPEEDQELQWASQGPAFSGDYLTHRHDPSQNDISPWGQGQDVRRTRPDVNKPATPQEIENIVLKAEKEALIKARLQQEKLKIQEENLKLQEQVNKALRLQEKLRQQAALMQASKKQPPVGPQVRPPNVYLETPPPAPNANLKSTYSVPPQTGYNQHNPYVNPQVQQQIQVQITPQQQKQIAEALAKRNELELANQRKEIASLIAKEQRQQLEQKQADRKEDALQKELLQAASITYDPFYSPILAKIDGILLGLGFKEEPCRERLICSMYKNPPKFSPHSNLLSAELSRDSKELQKPTSTNAAVIRFYKYVQAARDGQDKRDCIRLYPTCAVNTEI
ncbi:uncharacterized protein LOC109598904 [Aethina tumida]|uniref:uncharacterized protein LOC109598904 n=1 Tax=Aethina tumida TaxID=116153 RepID=UPI0021491A37|nr:uncharacterized protein LOC109598904 [Aethina tumida]